MEKQVLVWELDLRALSYRHYMRNELFVFLQEPGRGAGARRTRRLHRREPNDDVFIARLDRGMMQNSHRPVHSGVLRQH